MTGRSDQDLARDIYLSLSPYKSPVLRMLDDDELPKPFPACGSCPASRWYYTSMALKCFCTEMHIVTWGEAEKPVMFCDTREVEVFDLVQSLKDTKQARV